jgi:shikimate 5-dehydrogenase
VIGSGGTALAAVVALGSIGVDRVFVTARRFVAEPSGWPSRDLIGSLGGTLCEWPRGPEAEWWDLAASCDIVIQATSAGMRGADPGDAVRDVVPWQRLAPSAAALDVVYNPSVTPFLAAAQAAGLRAEGGLPMLVGQAESAIELWIGRRPPAELLSAAAAGALEAM